MRTASSSLAMVFLLFLISFSQALGVANSAALTSFPPSSVASSQLEFWHENVVNPMPEAVAAKLSPLSNQDSAFLLASFTSSHNNDEHYSSIPSADRFCSMAHLACTPLQKPFDWSTYIYPIFDSAQTDKSAIDGSLSLSADDDDDQTAARVAASSGFFRLSSVLQKGKRVQLPSFEDEIDPSRSFLPSRIASKIPTTCSAHLQKIFPDLFASLPTKQSIEKSILYCGNTDLGLKGEIKKCSNSLEGMIHFSKKTLGAKAKTRLMALTTESTRGSGQVLEVGNIKQFPDYNNIADDHQKVVACHEIFFPFASYFCHLIPSSVRVYEVDFVELATKAHVNKVVAVCHMDTAEWSAEHVALKLLKMSPGQGEVCHWFRKYDIAWIANYITDISSS